MQLDEAGVWLDPASDDGGYYEKLPLLDRTSSGVAWVDSGDNSSKQSQKSDLMRELPDGFDPILPVIVEIKE